MKSNEEKLNLLNEKLKKLKNILDEANSLIENEEKELVKKKDDYLKKISDESLIEFYENKKNEYGGLAFAQVSRNCCESCYSSLPPQLIIDIKNQLELVTCPTCSILLYLNKDD